MKEPRRLDSAVDLHSASAEISRGSNEACDTAGEEMSAGLLSSALTPSSTFVRETTDKSLYDCWPTVDVDEHHYTVNDKSRTKLKPPMLW